MKILFTTRKLLEHIRNSFVGALNTNVEVRIKFEYICTNKGERNHHRFEKNSRNNNIQPVSQQHRHGASIKQQNSIWNRKLVMWLRARWFGLNNIMDSHLSAFREIFTPECVNTYADRILSFPFGIYILCPLLHLTSPSLSIPNNIFPPYIYLYKMHFQSLQQYSRSNEINLNVAYIIGFVTFPNIWKISMTFSFNQWKGSFNCIFVIAIKLLLILHTNLQWIFGEIVFVSAHTSTHHIHKLWLTQQLKAADILSRRKNIKNTNNDRSMLKICSMKINRV